MVRRRLKVAAVVAALVCVALLALRWYDRAPKGRVTVRRSLPGMTTRVEAGLDDGAEVPRAAAGDLATIVCRVDTDGDPGVLRARGEGGSVDSTVSGGDLLLSLEPGMWSLAWSGSSSEDEGGVYRTLPLGSWELVAGDTRACVLTPEGVVVTGEVHDPDGGAVGGAFVEGCGTRLQAGADGHFSGAVRLGRTGRCSVRARYDDGALARYGDAAPVDLFSANTPLVLTVDPAPVAGLGIGFSIEPAGVRVTRVIPDSPAWAAGLEVGDMIVGLDGTSLAGVDVFEFVQLGTGREGSLARLDVVYDGVPEHVEFRRGRIPAEE